MILVIVHATTVLSSSCGLGSGSRASSQNRSEKTCLRPLVQRSLALGTRYGSGSERLSAVECGPFGFRDLKGLE